MADEDLYHERPGKRLENGVSHFKDYKFVNTTIQPILSNRMIIRNSWFSLHSVNDGGPSFLLIEDFPLILRKIIARGILRCSLPIILQWSVNVKNVKRVSKFFWKEYNHTWIIELIDHLDIKNFRNNKKVNARHFKKIQILAKHTNFIKRAELQGSGDYFFQNWELQRVIELIDI